MAHLAEIPGQVQQNGDTGRDLQQPHHSQRAENQRPVCALSRRLEARSPVLHVHMVPQVTAIIISCHERALLITSSVQEVGNVRGLLYKRWVGKAAALLFRDNQSNSASEHQQLNHNFFFMDVYPEKRTRLYVSFTLGWYQQQQCILILFLFFLPRLHGNVRVV